MYFSMSPQSTSYSTTSPMEIPTSNAASRSPSCAYPSWPRRDSLSSTTDHHNHSFIISDEELFPQVFDEDSSSSATSTPASDFSRSPASPRYVVESGSLMREVVRQEKAARQKEASGNASRKRSSSGASKKSRRGSKKMSPIQEVCE